MSGICNKNYQGAKIMNYNNIGYIQKKLIQPQKKK